MEDNYYGYRKKKGFWIFDISEIVYPDLFEFDTIVVAYSVSFFFSNNKSSIQ